MRVRKKLSTFYDFALGLARLSTCKRRSVGCIIVSPGLTQVYSVGYNGPAMGEHNDSCTGEEGVCGCVHAEANAMVKLTTTSVGLWLITTTCPCHHCAGLIVNHTGIGRVLYGDAYRSADGLNRLLKAGVITIPIGEEI